MIGQLKEGLPLWSSKLRARLRPSGDNVGRLARRHLDAGQVDASAQVLVTGMERFPGLSELEDVAHFVAQLQLRQQEVRMQEVLSSAREAYYKLAQAHISVDDLKAATETIWSGLQRFPDCAPLYRCLGELHLRLFLEDYLVGDGNSAAENLERTLGLDEADTRARTCLAGLYVRLGSYGRAAVHLRNLLERMSSDENDYAFIEKLLVRCNDHAEQPEDRPLSEYLSAVYDNCGPVENLGDWGWPENPRLFRRDVSLMEVKPDLIRKTVVEFLRTSKAAGTMILTRADEFIIGEVPFAHSPETLPGILRGLTQTGADSCHRMELGHSRRAMVQLSSGSLGFLRLLNAELVFLFGPGHAAKSVSQTMDDFTDCLALAIGENRESDSGAAQQERGD